MSAFKIIDKDYPLIVAQFNTQLFTMKDVEPYMNELEAVISRTQGSVAYITVVDENPKSLPAEVNKALNEKLLVLRQKHGHRTAAEYIVLSGLAARMVYKASAILIKPLRDTIVTSSLPEAMQKGLLAVKQHKSEPTTTR
ncbi:MAG: hypothetical protein MUC87_08170 [Bacteroidia bacterium]|jgi:hypothetical protein|nr:hypothetical protein [Bacteroidia bacterium]